MSDALLEELLEGTGIQPATEPEADLETEMEDMRAAIEAVAADIHNVEEETAQLVGAKNPFLFIEASFVLPAELAMWFLDLSQGIPSALMTVMLESIRENPTAEASLRDTAEQIVRFAKIAMQVAEDNPDHLERFNDLVNMAADANARPRDDLSDLVAELSRKTADNTDFLDSLKPQWQPGMSKSERRRVEMENRETRRKARTAKKGFSKHTEA